MPISVLAGRLIDRNRCRRIEFCGKRGKLFIPFFRILGDGFPEFRNIFRHQFIVSGNGFQLALEVLDRRGEPGVFVLKRTHLLSKIAHQILIIADRILRIAE